MTEINNIQNSNNVSRSYNQKNAEFKRITQRAAQSLNKKSSVFAALSNSTKDYILSSVEQALIRNKIK